MQRIRCICNRCGHVEERDYANGTFVRQFVDMYVIIKPYPDRTGRSMALALHDICETCYDIYEKAIEETIARVTAEGKNGTSH